MIRINPETYISFSPYIEDQMILSGWEYKQYWLFTIYKKKLC